MSHKLYTHDVRRLTNEILHHPMLTPCDPVYQRCAATRALLTPYAPHDSMLWRGEVVQDFGTLTPFFPTDHLSEYQY